MWQQITDADQMRELAALGLLYMYTSTQPEPFVCDTSQVFPHVASFMYLIRVEA